MLIILLAIVIWLAGMYFLGMVGAYALGFFMGEEKANQKIDAFLDAIFFWESEDQSESDER